MNIKQNLNDIYKGIYFYSLINESKETTKIIMNIRMIGLLYFYHLGEKICILIINVYVLLHRF